MKTAIRERLQHGMAQNSRSDSEQRKLCVVKPEDTALGHLHELISAEAAALAQLDKGPTDLLQALAELQLHGLCPMAAEAHHHATVDRLAERTAQQLSEKSPVFSYKKRIFIMPVGHLDDQALNRITDRALQIIQNEKVKKAVLHLKGLSSEPDAIARWQHQLYEELQSARIQIKEIP
ncbi:MAG: hypothetical protein JXX14_22635 [Deltaproteobacteria bacterium]|nr:hypothetical protein [Deltaproteobacteria bacterium]